MNIEQALQVLIDQDAIAFMQLTEEFNPTLKEEVALAAMAAISCKYN